MHKAFGAQWVLEGFTLDIPDGETTVIVGHSGAGKSVALKLIVGLLDPDHGSVEVDGQLVHTLGRDRLMELRARIGFVFQFAALFDSMTVAENLALGLRRRGVGEDEIVERSTEALEVVGLGGTEARYPAELSGGPYYDFFYPHASGWGQFGKVSPFLAALVNLTGSACPPDFRRARD